MKNELYPIGARVDYAVRPKATLNGNRIDGGWKQRVGIVKAIKRNFWGRKRYWICLLIKGSDVLDIVPESQIFGLVEKKTTHE